MVLSVRNKIRSMSVNGYGDQSKVKTESLLTVHWDEIRSINYVELTRIPRGDIISVVLTMNDGQNAVVDGIFNITGTRIDFLQNENISGSRAEVKYLI